MPGTAPCCWNQELKFGTVEPKSTGNPAFALSLRRCEAVFVFQLHTSLSRAEGDDVHISNDNGVICEITQSLPKKSGDYNRKSSATMKTRYVGPVCTPLVEID